MFRLRTLIIILNYLILPNELWGEGLEYFTHFNHARQKLLSPVDEVKNYEVTSQRIGMNWSGFLNNLDTSISFYHASPSYESILIRQKTGVELPLGQLTETKREYSIQTSLTGYLGSDLNWNLAGSADLNDHPYRRTEGNLSLSKSFNHGMTIMSTSLSHSQNRQPEQWYIDWKFKNQRRPLKLHTNQLQLSIEQLLSTRIKAGVDFKMGQRMEDRPPHFAIKIKSGYQILEPWFVRLSHSYLRELRSENLKDERGYFNSQKTLISLTWEPIFDLLLTGQYGIMFEQEENPITQKVTKSGVDQVGWGIEYPFQNFQLATKGSWQISNEQQTYFELFGGITWQM